MILVVFMKRVEQAGGMAGSEGLWWGAVGPEQKCRRNVLEDDKEG